MTSYGNINLSSTDLFNNGLVIDSSGSVLGLFFSCVVVSVHVVGINVVYIRDHSLLWVVVESRPHSRTQTLLVQQYCWKKNRLYHQAFQ